MDSGSNATGWYVGRKDTASEWKGGPFSWEQLLAFVAEGRVTAEDLVWHESLPDWVPAASVPGLFASTPPAARTPGPAGAASPQPPGVSAAAASPQPPGPAAAASSQPPSAPRPRAPRQAKPSRGGRTIGLAIAAVAVLALIAGAGYWAWSSGMLGGGKGGGSSLGVAEVTKPDRSKLITTKAYGEVPSNQIGIVLKDGSGRKDAESVARSVGGSVVGEIECANTFQIQFPASTEADLKRALSTAKASDKVSLAFVNQQLYNDTEIKGVRVTPDDDPIYGNGAGDGYKAIGFDKAWSFIRGSGVKLSDVHVGVVDDGIYKAGEGKENEFGGDVQVDFPDPEAGQLASPEQHKDGSVNAAGSHGTGVCTIIGADPDNGGPVGIAGPLGKKLKVSMINHFAGKYGDTTTTPDPNDPKKEVWYDGKSYLLGSLVALTKQVEGGAKVINCSWGNVHADPLDAAAYKHFFEKMAVDHPDVTFVCSGGNTGTALDGTHRYPSGLALPNMITVGAVNDDGTLADYSSKASANYEITLGAPGTKAVVGIKSGGGAERQSGTSFAAPHVTAAVAILRSINPDLTAAQIKDILVSTARKGTTVGKPGTADYHTNLAPPALGGRVLALDAAVLKVINDQRAEKGQKPITADALEKAGVIDAFAETNSAGEYKVRGVVEALGDQGTGVNIQVSGENYAIGGSTTQKLSAPGEVKWSVTLPKDKGTILVKRLDNGAASLINIESFDINGKWSGTFTITDVNVDDEAAAKNEGCAAAIYEKLKGKALPMTMDITADENGNGTAETLIDVSSLNTGGNGSASSEPQRFGITYSGSTVTFDTSGSKGMSSMTGQVSREGDNLVMKGALKGGGKGWSIKAVFTVTKPDGSGSGG